MPGDGFRRAEAVTIIAVATLLTLILDAAIFNGMITDLIGRVLINVGGVLK